MNECSLFSLAVHIISCMHTSVAHIKTTENLTWLNANIEILLSPVSLIFTIRDKISWDTGHNDEYDDL